ncbi:hypothetical protein NAL19_516 [Pectobacterium sp. F1-1]|nr:hypothetical protein NAL19_516 [Pectobacterium sp. F1-1]
MKEYVIKLLCFHKKITSLFLIGNIIGELLFIFLFCLGIFDALKNLVFKLLSKNFTKNQRMVSSFYFYKI